MAMPERENRHMHAEGKVRQACGEGGRQRSSYVCRRPNIGRDRAMLGSNNRQIYAEGTARQRQQRGPAATSADPEVTSAGFPEGRGRHVWTLQRPVASKQAESAACVRRLGAFGRYSGELLPITPSQRQAFPHSARLDVAAANNFHSSRANESVLQQRDQRGVSLRGEVGREAEAWRTSAT